MRARALAAVVIVIALAVPAVAGAGGPAGFFFRGSFSGGDAASAGAAFSAFAIGLSAAGDTYPRGWREDPATLIVDVTPADARVYLDGRPLGLAGELVARGLPVPLGLRVVQVEAPGYRTRVWQFVADGSFPIRIRTTLSAE